MTDERAPETVEEIGRHIRAAYHGGGMVDSPLIEPRQREAALVQR